MGIQLANSWGDGLRSLRIGVRLTCCFAVMVAIMLLGVLPAIWQMNIYHSQVARLSSIDRRMISVLKVNNRVLGFREMMKTAAEGSDAERMRTILVPFRNRFVQDVAEASDALQNVGPADESLQRTMLTLMSYQTAIPVEIDATLDLAQFNDWQAIHFRLDKQMIKTSRVLSHIVSEIETEANAQRKMTLETMSHIRYRIVGLLPMSFFLVLLLSGSLLGAKVTRSIAEPLSSLESGAQALGAGIFSHRVAVKGRDELATVALAFNNAAEQIERLHAGLEGLVVERTADLRQANESLQKLSAQDPLTGIANRRTLDHMLRREIDRAVETRRSVSLLMMDIDHFKGLNDTYGHQRGDECLIRVVRTIGAAPLRNHDLIARYGGEEFAVVLPDTDAAGAKEVAERMRATVENLGIPNRGSPLLQKLTVSIGVATLRPERNVPISDLIELADKALYRAKEDGRNRIRVCEQGVVSVMTPDAEVSLLQECTLQA